MEPLQAVEDVLALGVNVISEISRVNTRICGNLLLIQALDGAQSVVGRKAELAVAFHLQRGKVKQTWRSFAAFLLETSVISSGSAFTSSRSFFPSSSVLNDFPVAEKSVSR